MSSLPPLGSEFVFHFYSLFASPSFWYLFTLHARFFSQLHRFVYVSVSPFLFLISLPLCGYCLPSVVIFSPCLSYTFIPPIYPRSYYLSFSIESCEVLQNLETRKCQRENQADKNDLETIIYHGHIAPDMGRTITFLIIIYKK